MSPARRQSRDRAGPARAHGAVHGRRQGAAAQELVPAACGRAAARSARASSTRRRSANSSAIVRDEVVVGFPDTRAFATEGELFGGFGGSARAIADPPAACRRRGAERGRRSRAQAADREVPRRQRAGVGRPPTPAEPELRVHRRRPPPRRSRLEPPRARHGRAHARRRHVAGRTLRRRPAPGRSSCARNGWDAPEALAAAPLATPLGGVLPLGELAQLRPTMAPSQLRRVDRRRTVTLTVDPPPTLSLEEALGDRRRRSRAGAARGACRTAPACASPAAPIASTKSVQRDERQLRDGAARAVHADGGDVQVAAGQRVRDAALPMAVFGGVLGLRVLGAVRVRSRSTCCR